MCRFVNPLTKSGSASIEHVLSQDQANELNTACKRSQLNSKSMDGFLNLLKPSTMAVVGKDSDVVLDSEA